MSFLTVRDPVLLAEEIVLSGEAFAEELLDLGDERSGAGHAAGFHSRQRTQSHAAVRLGTRKQQTLARAIRVFT